MEADLAQLCCPPHLLLLKMERSHWWLGPCVQMSCVDPAQALSFLSLHLYKAALAAPKCSLLFCFFDNVDYRLSTFVLSY